MYFFLCYMMTIFGFMMASICGLMPLQDQPMIPDMFRGVLFMFGLVLSMVGLILLHTRAIKVGANHLIAPGRPENILWFYVYRDGTVRITPSMRDVEGQLYSKELDAAISEFRSYRLHDHSIRFVPEGLGSSADLDLCLYAYVLKTKHGFSNILQARNSILKKPHKLIPQEHSIDGKELNELPTNPKPTPD